MLHSDPRQSFRVTSLLFSGYTLSLLGRVFGEQWGGATEFCLESDRAWKLEST
jgi:hypothetical protein